MDQQIQNCVQGGKLENSNDVECRRCGESKDSSHFSKGQIGNPNRICKSCRSKLNRDWKKSNPGYMDKWRYDLSVEDKERISKEQGGTCANENCQYGLDDDHKLYVDHCHETGKVRGLLCHHCNTALGLLMESPEKISGLMYYAKRHIT